MLAAVAIEERVEELAERVIYLSIYCKLHSVAVMLVEDDKYTHQNAAEDILSIMEYIASFT
jgi:hypothetical protein